MKRRRFFLQKKKAVLRYSQGSTATVHGGS